MRIIPDAVLDTARRLRDAGESWNNIARAVGFDRDVIRSRIDPEYAERRQSKYAGPKSMLRLAPYRPSQKEIDRLKGAIPADTRSFTSRAMGDPLPGRSALDRKLSPAPVDGSHSVHITFDVIREAEDIRDRPFSREAV